MRAAVSPEFWSCHSFLTVDWPELKTFTDMVRRVLAALAYQEYRQEGSLNSGFITLNCEFLHQFVGLRILYWSNQSWPARHSLLPG